MNYDYPDGDYATREKIFSEHLDYQQGLMWTLANHPRVPEKIREQCQTLGPGQGRVHGHRQLAAPALRPRGPADGQRLRDDAAQLPGRAPSPRIPSAWPPTRWTRTTSSATSMHEGHVRNEGDVQVGGFPPYPISYRSIVPKESECQNLLVPVCLSASHISYGSIRMEPVFMVLGQSSATAAAMAIDADTSVQKVDYAKLRERLLADKQVLAWTGPRRSGQRHRSQIAAGPGARRRRRPKRRGDWSKSTSIGGYVGTQYLHDDNAAKGRADRDVQVRAQGAGHVRSPDRLHGQSQPGDERADHDPPRRRRSARQRQPEDRAGDRQAVPLARQVQVRQRSRPSSSPTPTPTATSSSTPCSLCR